MPPPWHTGSHAVIAVSDLHVGRQNARSSERTARALSRIVEHANTRDIGQLVLNGDVFDERAHWETMQEEMAIIRGVLSGFRHGPANIRFLYGNHDIATDRHATEDICNLLGSCRVEQQWIAFDELAGITYTHGHIFGTGYAKRSLRRIARQEDGDIASLCASEKFQHKINMLHHRYVAAVVISKWLMRMGIPVEHVWEILRSRSHLLRAVGAARLREPGEFARMRGALAALIDLSSYRISGELGTAMGSWCTLIGHTHTPAVTKRTVVRDGTRLPHLIGNSGSFVSKAGFPITCIEARFPELILWEYDPSADTLKERKKATLTPEEQAMLR